jgi:hypothetical protein
MLGSSYQAGNGERKVLLTMENDKRKPIKSFQDLEVYQNS